MLKIQISRSAVPFAFHRMYRLLASPSILLGDASLELVENEEGQNISDTGDFPAYDAGGWLKLVAAGEQGLYKTEEEEPKNTF